MKLIPVEDKKNLVFH